MDQLCVTVTRLQLGEYQCRRCAKLFWNTPTLNRHIKSKTCTDPATLSAFTFIYNLQYTFSQNLKAHAHAGESDAKRNHKYSCMICTLEFEGRSELVTHNKKSHNDASGLYKCSTCGLKLSRLEHLKRHIVYHHTQGSDKPYECTTCKKRFSTAHDLKTHHRTHTGEKPFPSRFCETRFSTKVTARSHERTHTGDKPYNCSYCDKSFIRSSARGAHMRSHTQEKPHSCDICSRAFAHRPALVYHRRTHTGEKPCVCPTCSAEFICPSRLRRHVLRHHLGIKPRSMELSCSFCDKELTTNAGLIAHTRLHTGEKPYGPCQHCGKRFTTLGNLKKHLGAHERGGLHVCPSCGKRCQSSHAMKAHHRIAHTGD